MSPSQSKNAFWPAQTEHPLVPPTSSTRKRKTAYAREPGASTSKVARQIVTDPTAIETAKQQCQITSGNEIISCFPTDDTVIPQHQWATFVWNSRRPEITQTNLVDIFLFHGDSQSEIFHWHNVRNPVDQAGSITAQVNDTWFADRGTAWNGQNISYPYYWVLIRSDKTLDGSQIPQSTFTAVQTTMADWVVSSMSSTASAAAASSSAAAASLSSLHSSPSSSSGLQSGKGGSSFPHWAIAVITVLGFLALVTFCILLFLLFRRMRRRESSNRGSMGSSSPMMANVQSSHAPHTPLLEGAALVGRKESSSQGHHAPSVTSPDGASTISRANSADQGPFSGADAAIMADAFRKALRKPDFAEQPVEEGESPPEPEQKDEALINRELAEEGRGIRSVGSSRGVKVEALNDSGQTAAAPH